MRLGEHHTARAHHHRLNRRCRHGRAHDDHGRAEHHGRGTCGASRPDPLLNGHRTPGARCLWPGSCGFRRRRWPGCPARSGRAPAPRAAGRRSCRCWRPTNGFPVQQRALLEALFDAVVGVAAPLELAAQLEADRGHRAVRHDRPGQHPGGLAGRIEAAFPDRGGAGHERERAFVGSDCDRRRARRGAVVPQLPSLPLWTQIL